MADALYAAIEKLRAACNEVQRVIGEAGEDELAVIAHSTNELSDAVIAAANKLMGKTPPSDPQRWVV